MMVTFSVPYNLILLGTVSNNTAQKSAEIRTKFNTELAFVSLG